MVNGTWGDYVLDHEDESIAFRNGENIEPFFRTMYKRFYAELEMRTIESVDFWKNLTPNESAGNVAREANSLGVPELQKLDFEKRKIAIKILMARSVYEPYENAVIRLVGITGPGEEQKMLNFLATDIKFNEVFSKFDDFMGDDNFTRIMTLISSYIENPKPNIDAIKLSLSYPPQYVSIDVDIVDNRQDRWLFYR